MSMIPFARPANLFPALGLAVLALAGLGSPPSTQARPPRDDADTFGTQFVQRINEERKKAGAPAMVRNAALGSAAAAHARACAEADSWKADGKSPLERVGDRKTADPSYWAGGGSASVDAWVKEQLHKAESRKYFLDPRATQFGSGVAESKSGKVYAVVLLGRAPSSGGGTGGDGKAAATVEEFTTQILKRINEERKKAGAPSMVVNPALTQGASRYAADRAKADSWEGGRGAIESVADRRYVLPTYWGGWGSLDADAWAKENLHKPEGRKFFLDPEATQLGAGEAKSKSGKVFVIVVLGKERAKVTDEKSRKVVTDEIVALVNAERHKAGVKPLKLNDHLIKAAQGHAENMARQNLMKHELDGKNPSQRMKDAGYPGTYTLENIASGEASAKEVMNVWMNSPGHKKNILDPRVTEIGVGAAQSAKTADLYFCQCFGQPE